MFPEILAKTMFQQQHQHRQRPPTPAWAGNGPNQLARLPEVNEVGSIVVTGVRAFAKRYKYVTA